MISNSNEDKDKCIKIEKLIPYMQVLTLIDHY